MAKNEWPFPAPLVKSGKGWRFDGKAGAEEIEHRRIGRNELLVMAACTGYVDAQLEYLSGDHDDDGLLEYATRINSTPGRHEIGRASGRERGWVAVGDGAIK